MTSFREFLNEELAQFKHLKHLTHVEDLAFYGKDGMEKAKAALSDAHDTAKGVPSNTKVTTKLDGAPSIVFGRHPSTGKFFVGSKSVFNADPKINYSHEDIDKNHKDAPGLAAKLHQALDHLPKVAPKKGVYQGDMMYGKDDVTTTGSHHNFTPNTLMYSVKKDSPEGKKVEKAQFGIAVHTKYHGPSIEKMHAGFDVDKKNFKQHPDVHIVPHEHQATKLIDKTTSNKVAKNLKAAEETVMTDHDHDVVSTHRPHLEKYINQTVKNEEKPSVAGFRQSVIKSFKKEAEGLKSDKGKLKKHEQLLQHMAHIDDNHESYDKLLKVHGHLTAAKNALVDHFSKDSPYETSINGNESKGEGFVVTHNGFPAKFVDRAEFSKANFSNTKYAPKPAK